MTISILQVRKGICLDSASHDPNNSIFNLINFILIKLFNYANCSENFATSRMPNKLAFHERQIK